MPAAGGDRGAEGGVGPEGGDGGETDQRGHNRTWRDAQPGWILRELRRVGAKDPVFVLDKLGPARGPAGGARPGAGRPLPRRVRGAALRPAGDPVHHDGERAVPDFADAAGPARDRRPARFYYTEAEKVAIAESHLIDTQNRAAGLTARPVRFTRGACRRIVRDYTKGRGIRQLARCLQAICRKATLSLETGDASLVRDRITARRVRAFLGEPGAGHTDGLARLRDQLDAPALPPAVRARGREVLEGLSAWATIDPDHARAREYLQCLLSVPWTARTEERLDLGAPGRSWTRGKRHTAQ